MLLCRRVHYCLLPSPPFQVEKGNWDMVRWLGWTWVESHDWAAPGTSHASCQAHRPVEISASVTVGNASFLQMLPAASALLTPCRCRGSPVPPQPFVGLRFLTPFNLQKISPFSCRWHFSHRCSGAHRAPLSCWVASTPSQEAEHPAQNTGC